MKKTIILTATLALALGACSEEKKSPFLEEEPAEASAPETANLNAAQKAYAKANARMHAGMDVIDEDADTAFIQGMIPHHQGAVDMANIVLEHGDDEETKELARNIIKAQEEEITWMRNWLKERGLEEIKASDHAGHDHSDHDHHDHSDHDHGEHDHDHGEDGHHDH
ncbi:MAG: DUF305 domain-containing protein [Pseudomonadota bacterium]